jgi:hypothetical protein
VAPRSAEKGNIVAAGVEDTGKRLCHLSQSGAWLSAGGIDNSGHDGGGGSSTGNGN